VKEKRLTKKEWIIKNVKMNEKLEKEQMMKEIKGNVQNEIYKDKKFEHIHV
jgi:hypothetical protein